MRYLALVLLSLAASFTGLSQAQEPPGRVGRLAYAQGTVSVYQDPELGWDKAYVNTPITSENSVWTERGSRAELRVSGIAIRLDETTQLDISRLDEDELIASMERGSANIRVRYKQPRERIAIETPHARFSLQADGRYRIDVDPERDESRLTVFAGDARMQSQGGSIRVATGGTMRVFGGPNPSYVTERASSDAFDRWADARDREWVDSRARQYVSTDMTGYEDLDRYGDWAQDADYGALWFPTRVASDWAPYSTGRWAHVRPWGWTWVDDSPWGYAPFHYGRWVNVRNRWAWAPGQRVSRPAWAPALVGWVGGSNWSVGISSGGSAPVVGWYPLAPWERYEPSYRSNRAYNDRLNIAVRDRAPRDYQGRGDDWRRYNRDLGTTVVQRDALIDRRPVQSSRVQVGMDALRQQQVVAAAQVQQVLPQGNEMVRRTRDRNQAPIAAPPMQQAQPQPQQQGRPQPAQQGQQGEGARPRFGGFAAPAPVAAPANTPPPSAANPAARGSAPQQQQQQGSQQQTQQQQAREAQERAAREAQVQQQNQLQRQQQEAAAREAQQQQQNQLQRQTREAQQQQERAAREGQQQREAQQRQQQEAAAREAQQQQQNQLQRQTREAQQQQERAAREGQQQREAQQRQQQEAAAREAQQQQQNQLQRQTREAQQQQERAQREAQQQQQRSAQQLQQQQERAAREAQQQAQRAAQEAQQAAQRAAQEAQQQQQNRAARGGQPQPQAQPQPQPAPPQAQPQPAPPPQANPAARGNREQQQREKEEKDKEEKDKKDKKN